VCDAKRQRQVVGVMKREELAARVLGKSILEEGTHQAREARLGRGVADLWLG
jgi:hypothetical protein